MITITITTTLVLQVQLNYNSQHAFLLVRLAKDSEMCNRKMTMDSLSLLRPEPDRCVKVQNIREK